MTVRVERVFEIPASREQVWAFIADPEKRAGAISVVTDFSRDGDTFVWELELPIPVIRRTVSVETRDVDRRPPEYVRFVGRSRVMHVVGEHELQETDAGTRVVNRFTVEGKLPGVERFFDRNFDSELEALETALRAELGLEV